MAHTDTTPDPMTEYHPDSAAGALAAAQALMGLTDDDVARATVQMDPWVRGCWRLLWPAAQPASQGMDEAIVWLAGYADPMGDERAHNDVECGYSDPADDCDDDTCYRCSAPTPHGVHECPACLHAHAPEDVWSAA